MNEPATAVASNRKNTGTLARFAFATLVSFVGFCVGMLGAGAFLVPAGSGLAGPAIALGYALAAAAISFVAGLAFASRARAGAFRRLFLVVLAVTLTLIGWLAYRIVT